MRWIKEHMAQFVIILALVIAAAAGFAYFKGPEGSGFFNRIYIAMEKPMTTLGSGVAERFSGAEKKKNLKAENERLRKENAALKKENRELTLTENELRELRDLSKALSYELDPSEEKLVTANIVDMDDRGCLKTFVIDRGKDDGIEKDDVVISGQGLVGRVTKASKKTSRIISILDESSKISFKLGRDIDVLGMLTETKNGKLEGYLLDNAARISEGDSVITSGMGRYPADLRIGKVVKTGYDSNKQLIRVTVKPGTDFGYMCKVSVII